MESSSSSTRAALLAAAVAELEECGHAGISLRAVARRAGVSHAAPKHHFADRAGLLTAVATRGFDELGATLDGVREVDPQHRLAALGQAYIDYGLAHAALFDLMFRPTELHPDDPVLHQARRDAIDPLRAAVARLGTCDDASPESLPLTLISWAFVHGLVVLARDDALQTGAEPAGLAAAGLAHELTDLFSAYVGRGQGTLPRPPGRGP